MIKVYHFPDSLARKIMPIFDVKLLQQTVARHVDEYLAVAEVTTDELETAYMATNSIEEEWWLDNDPRVKSLRGPCRSTTVGDVLALGDGSATFLVAPTGFLKLETTAKVTELIRKNVVDDQTMLICSAYESGFGRGESMRDESNPYVADSIGAKAYRLGWELGKKRQEEKPTERPQRSPIQPLVAALWRATLIMQNTKLAITRGRTRLSTDPELDSTIAVCYGLLQRADGVICGVCGRLHEHGSQRCDDPTVKDVYV